MTVDALYPIVPFFQSPYDCWLSIKPVYKYVNEGSDAAAYIFMQNGSQQINKNDKVA